MVCSDVVFEGCWMRVFWSEFVVDCECVVVVCFGEMLYEIVVCCDGVECVVVVVKVE